MERLSRTLGPGHAVVVGLGAMLGAGVFVVVAPAAAAAGRALPLALALAGAVAWANADSSARLAAVLPTSGGAYAYGRARLGAPAGVVAGVAFLVGKTISSAAIAWTAGTYLWPDGARPLAVAAVVLLTALACAGVRRGAGATAVVVAVVLATLAAVVVAALLHATGRLAVDVPPAGALPPAEDAAGVLHAAGLCFFAFAGYARIATLGEEVRDPARTLPRAIAAALGTVLVTYGAVAWAVTSVLGADVVATARPVAVVAEVLVGPGAAVAVAVVAALAALASGLGVLLGLSRTTLAMARDGVLPRPLAHLDGAAGLRRPVRAQLVVGAAVVAVVLVVDLERAIALSSVAVLVYYGVAHLAALTLPGRVRRVVPVLGLLGCLTVAASLVR